MVRRMTRTLIQTLRNVDESFARGVQAHAGVPQPWCGPLCENTMRGHLNFKNASILRKALFALLAKPRRVIGIKCDQVEFADGAAVAAVLEFAMACQEAGTRLYFMDPSESLVNAFRFYGLSSMIDALSSRAPVVPTSQAVEMGDPLVIVIDDNVPDSIRIDTVNEAA